MQVLTSGEPAEKNETESSEVQGLTKDGEEIKRVSEVQGLTKNGDGIKEDVETADGAGKEIKSQDEGVGGSVKSDIETSVTKSKCYLRVDIDT